MESFNFLKFWRTTAAVRDIDSDIDSVKKFANAVDYVGNPAPESTDEEIDNDQDSFFDLVFMGSKETSINKLNSPDVLVKPKPLPMSTSPNSVLKPAPKFRVCFLGFRKSKPEKVDIDDSSTEKAHEIKMKEVPISCVSFSKLPKVDEESSKQFARADMGKYLKLMKPLYTKASKRYTDKVKISDKISPSMQSLNSSRISSELEKHGNRAAVLGAVRKRLGKSRSTASSFTGASISPMNRRDSSLLQEQNDGIQGAILHCKRSYSSARKDCSVLLSRNANEDCLRVSCEEQNRWSI